MRATNWDTEPARTLANVCFVRSWYLRAGSVSQFVALTVAVLSVQGRA